MGRVSRLGGRITLWALLLAGLASCSSASPVAPEADTARPTGIAEPTPGVEPMGEMSPSRSPLPIPARDFVVTVLQPGVPPAAIEVPGEPDFEAERSGPIRGENLPADQRVQVRIEVELPTAWVESGAIVCRWTERRGLRQCTTTGATGGGPLNFNGNHRPGSDIELWLLADFEGLTRRLLLITAPETSLLTPLRFAVSPDYPTVNDAFGHQPQADGNYLESS